GFELVVGLRLAAGGFLAEVPLQIRGERREKGVLEHPLVGGPTRRLDLAALVQPEAPGPGDGAIASGARLGEGAHAGQRGQQRGHVALRAGPDGRDVIPDLIDMRCDFGEVVPIARVADRPRHRAQYERANGHADRRAVEPLAVTLPARVDPSEPGLGEYDLAQEPRQEVTP